MKYSDFSDEELLQLSKKTRKSAFMALPFVLMACVIIVFSLKDWLPYDIGIALAIFCYLFAAAIIIYVNLRAYPINAELSKRNIAKSIQQLHQIIPDDCKTTVTVINSNIRYMDEFGYGLRKNVSYYIWREESNLKFYPTANIKGNIENLPKIMPIKDILFYESIGELYHENKISGGGGKKVSIPGALIGGAVGGTAGAMLLGDKGSKSIQSKDVSHDTRAVRMRFSEQRTIDFSYSDLTVFEMLLPEKSSSAVASSNPEHMTSNFSSADEILKYKNLLDQGIITPEEFEQKKSQLLKI